MQPHSALSLDCSTAAAQYPLDVIEGYNHLGIVWSNRGQHTVAHAYLSIAQQAFLRFKKARQAEMTALEPAEKQRIEAEDRRLQEEQSEPEQKSAEESKQEGKEAEADAKSSDNASSDFSQYSSAASPAQRLLHPRLWHTLETTHTLTLFFLAQVFGHMKKRDLAAIYCHLCLNRQLKQRRDFDRHAWVTNAIGLSFYYSGRKQLQQAHHCLLAAQHFIKPEDMPRKKIPPTA